MTGPFFGVSVHQDFPNPIFLPHQYMKFADTLSYLTSLHIGAGSFIIAHFKSLVFVRDTLNKSKLNTLLPVTPFYFNTVGYFLKILVVSDNDSSLEF